MRLDSPRWWVKADRHDDSTTTHTGADCPQAPRGRSGAERGRDLAAVSRHLEVSEQTYHRWRAQYGGMRADDTKRLKELEKENSTLKRLLADSEVEKAALKEIAKVNW